LQDSNEISSGLDVVGAFKLYDMVLLESGASSLSMPSVGVVIQLEKDMLQVKRAGWSLKGRGLRV
jgi:hypothetical protein